MSVGITEYILDTLTDLVEHVKSASMPQLVMELNNIVRKVAHACIFFLLGILLYFAFRSLFKKNVWIYLSALSGLAVIAALDEFHQFFVQGRAPMVSDVILDICGGAAGLFFMLLLQLGGRFLTRTDKPVDPS